jgi:hypothetical protein
MKGSRIQKMQENRLKDGRGQGYMQEYRPFIQANDNKVASEGWLTREIGWKTGRIHHTLSKHELHFLLYLNWCDSVVDVREQYPLTPIERTQEIADQLNIKHAHVDEVPVFMTTDFVISIKKGNEIIEVVRTVKPQSKLTPRTIELFEIERRYFTELGMPWRIVLDIDLPMTLIQNVDWMFEAKNLDTRPSVDQEVIELIADHFFEQIVKDQAKTPISKLCLRCDKLFGLEWGTCLFILQHMLANKHWQTNMNQAIAESKPLFVCKKTGE